MRALPWIDLYSQYVRWSRATYSGDVPMCYVHFLRLWQDNFPRLIVAGKFEGACERCCLLTAAIHRAEVGPKKKAAKAELDAHWKLKEDAKAAWERQIIKSSLDRTLCLIFDFSESIMLPYFRVRPNNLFFKSMPLAVVGGPYDCSKSRSKQHDCLRAPGYAGEL